MDEERSNPPIDSSIAQSDYSRGRLMNQSSMTLTRGYDSTRLLFKGENFQQARSEQDFFFDCQGPGEDSPKEGRSATSRCKLDDPAAIREALERAANATQMLLKNFDTTGWNQPCAVTLELTARLVDPKKGRAGCPLHGKPVTVQMPLEFNPQSGKVARCQQKKPPVGRQRKETMCQCRLQRSRPAPRGPKPSSECPALMYMHHERHSNSDPNSRHQQTELSHLRDHWKPSKTQRSQQSDCEDPRAKPSQTEDSFLRKHHTPSNPDNGPSCSCSLKRSKSADPPAVKAHPCGLGHQEKPSSKKPCSQKSSGTGPEPTSFKSAITACTKELLDPCSCGTNPPYWAGQSNLVTGPSYSRAMDPSKSFKSSNTLAPLHKPGASLGRSKSLASLSSKPNPPTQSGVTWLSALKDPESEGCPAKEEKCPPFTYTATQTDQEPSMSSHPQSHPNYRSMTSKSSTSRVINPRNQLSFGVGEETSATTRSQSIVGKVTCLCGSEHQTAKGFVSSLADREYTEGAEQIQIVPCPSTRIQHPSGFAQFNDCQTSQFDPSPSSRSRKGRDEFCDCDASDNDSELSDPIQTSLHTHRSLSGASCLCKGDATPPEEPAKLTCVSKQCQCSSKDDLRGMQSAQDGTGYQTPEDPCGMACCSRKERIMILMEKLTSPSCDCGVSRSCLTQQLFRELTLLLRSEKENAVAPADEPSPPPLTFDECCATQHDRNGEEEPAEKPLSKRELQRVECFHQLEEYLCKCFLPPAEPQIPETDIYAFELDPDFPPDPEPPKSPEEKDKMKPCQCPEPFFDIGNALTCSGDGLDDDFFRDCEDDEDAKKCDCKDDDRATGEPDLCQSLKAFIDKELQEILAEEINKEVDEGEEPKTPTTVLKEICERPTVAAPPEEEEKSEKIECPYLGMVSCPPWTTQQTDWADFPYNLDPCAQKESPSPPPKGPRTGLLPEGPLPPDVRNLCEQLLRKALKDCGLCGDDGSLHSCEDDVCEECALDCEECPEDCPLEKCDEFDDECPQEEQGCLCCHCRALICDEECKTVSNTLRSAMCDPLCEMKYFIDSIIVDMHAMDCVLGNKQAKPKHIKAKTANYKGGPGDSFPVKITGVCGLGDTALYVRWNVEDCRAIAGYEIYMDGHLKNRFYSFRHEAGVITNVDVTNPHLIVLRALAVGQEFPGEGPGKDGGQDCGCQEMAVSHPELKAGAQRPWSPSFFYYDPNQMPPSEGVQ
ncbi:uncharacterized protein LOC6536273 [Drosophila yakuba]|uniref:PFTAIRE-interacting factor 1B n=1 Tax=Drosophila yakuba TaxID=7245 RepID=B4PTW0_DROYA|nr:uncharacterized protein LOC6536273 [Drosophila yakuba]EDW96571.2 uncharacterized protein Dyak_GE24824 [Drosophila yakuba]